MATAVSDVRTTEAIDVWELEQYLGVALRNLDPDAVPARDSERMWTSFMGLARFAVAGATLMARRGGGSGAWEGEGKRTAAGGLWGGAGGSPFGGREEVE